MRLLLDTNAFLWSLAEPERLGDHRELVEDRANDLFVSVVSAWEISIKHALGKLSLQEAPDRYVPGLIQRLDAETLTVDLAPVLAVARLPLLHGDPFDRLLIAQAKLLGLTIVTSDRRFPQYDVPTILLG